MSYDFKVYLKNSCIPEPTQLAAEVQRRTTGLALPAWFDVRKNDGFVPIGSTGFEVWRASITAERIEDYKNDLEHADDAAEEDYEYLKMLIACDTTVTFNCRDESEVAAARTVAGALAKLSDGFVCDPQSGVTVKADYLPLSSTMFSRGS